jgi:hypothetical protein
MTTRVRQASENLLRLTTQALSEAFPWDTALPPYGPINTVSLTRRDGTSRDEPSAVVAHDNDCAAMTQGGSVVGVLAADRDKEGQGLRARGAIRVVALRK